MEVLDNQEPAEQFLKATDVIDWHNPSVLAKAKELAKGVSGTENIAQRCFEWVRDNIQHSADFKRNPVTCSASEVLTAETGYCYAKSHLLGALLRANGIPVGFCYQRLSLDETGAAFSLHGLNAVYLPRFGWYRVDSRGNKAGVDAQFSPPRERLAFKVDFFGGKGFSGNTAGPIVCCRDGAPHILHMGRAIQEPTRLEPCSSTGRCCPYHKSLFRSVS